MRKLAVLITMLTLAPALGGCVFVINRGSDEVDVHSVDRTEQARAREARMHPACRDSRADRDDQPEGCDRVVRRGQ